MKNKKLCILIIDDILSVRTLVRLFLKEHQDMLVFEEAGSCQEALEKAKRISPDIILTDMSLPDGSGLDVAKQVKEMLPKTGVYLFSAYELDEIRHLTTLKSPVDGFIQKSELKAELHAMIVKEFERRVNGRK
ncbi:MAG: response regulator transcription factor [Bacteroidota bacterium]